MEPSEFSVREAFERVASGFAGLCDRSRVIIDLAQNRIEGGPKACTKAVPQKAR
jgi:hypothetical protein